MKTKCLMYCTKALPNLHKLDENEFYNDRDTHYNGLALNGKIVCECEIETEKMGRDTNKCIVFDDDFNEESQLTLQEMVNYIHNNYYYVLHISNLNVFDNPLELKDTYTRECTWNKCSRCEYGKEGKINCGTIDIPLSRAPQNMMWVWYKGERYVLISIQSKWLCKILNGEKTIEVRRKVLKGMVE